MRRVWPVVRRFVPLRVYPLLARIYRLVRSRTLREEERREAEYRAAHPGVILPPVSLRSRVVAVDCTIEQFLEGGAMTVADVERSLASIGCPIATMKTALDFGCGCGRVILAARQAWPHLELHGSDVDGDAIAWCHENIPGGHFVRNEPMPPLPYADGTFDLIWVASVFTHLDEARQDAWLAELRRVLRPDGVLLASVQGTSMWEGLPKPVVQQIRANGFLFVRTGADAGIHAEWYQAAWHTEEYVRRHWSHFFDVRGYVPQGLNGIQDMVIAVKPLSA